MFENVDVPEAIKRSIQTEKYARDFYLLGAKHMKNQQACRTFELLAAEEVDYAPDSDWLTDLERVLMEGLNERKAMELAMDKELKLEQALRTLAEKISDKAVREVFIQNAESTHQHYAVIESEYARLMGMVHETDIDTYVRE